MQRAGMSEAKPVTRIELPELCVAVMVGVSGSGKSTFTRKHFLRTEVLSSDFFRGLISDDENDQSVTKDAFESLYYVAAKRLAKGKLTVIDATNVRPKDRKGFVQLAAQFHCPAVAIVLNIPVDLCLERNRARNNRTVNAEVLRDQSDNLRLHLHNLEREGFSHVHILSTLEEVAAVELVRIPTLKRR
jgi:protein phosphatase